MRADEDIDEVKEQSGELVHNETTVTVTLMDSEIVEQWGWCLLPGGSVSQLIDPFVRRSRSLCLGACTSVYEEFQHVPERAQCL